MALSTNSPPLLAHGESNTPATDSACMTKSSKERGMILQGDATDMGENSVRGFASRPFGRFRHCVES